MIKRLVFSVVVCVSALCSITANAFQYIDESYTSLKATNYGDTIGGPFPFVGDTTGSGRLGGVSARNGWIMSGSQFIVGQPAIVNYVSVTALLIPNLELYDNARSEYIHKRLAEGATPEQISLELQDGTGLALVVGPAQSMDVSFALVKGTRQYHNDGPEIIPANNILATANYTFYTDNSRYNKEYSDLLIPFGPFNTELSPNETYWVVGTSPGNGTTFGYHTKLVGEVNTPEPATMLLMGGGLAGMLWRRRRVTKLK